MKTTVLVVHPNIKQSRVNAALRPLHNPPEAQQTMFQ